jgi:predicted nucleic acid-binding protein
LSAGNRIIVPEIADYEVRRELFRMQKARSLARLDAIAASFEYLPLSTAAMRHAAELGAQARQQGRPTAADKALDADVILAAQVLTLSVTNSVVATTNLRHLSRFVVAEVWQNIPA